MPEENDQADSDRPRDDQDREPEAESWAEIAAAVEYGERYEACQVTARKVRAARDLIELAGGYKEAAILADALWFSDSDKPIEVKAAVNNEDDSDVEYGADCEAWEARTRKVMAAEKLLNLCGYDEAFMLLDTIIVVEQGQQGHEQVAKVRGAAAGYHQRVAAALDKKAENE